MGTLTIILSVLALAGIIYWMFFRTPSVHPQNTNESDTNDSMHYDRMNYLETIKTVFSGAQTDEQREQFVNENKFKITRYLEYADFQTGYQKLAKQYGVTGPKY